MTNALDVSCFEDARLFSVMGIRNNDEAEKRVTSSLLAVLKTVPGLRDSLLRTVGVNNAASACYHAYTEPDFGGRVEGVRHTRPDALLRLSRGSSDKVLFSALIEVKTGNAKLRVAQLLDYLRIARQLDINAVISVANDAYTALRSDDVPQDEVETLRGVQYCHWTWRRVYTTVMEQAHTVDDNDPEQQWLITELLRYMRHRNSGIRVDDSAEIDLFANPIRD